MGDNDDLRSHLVMTPEFACPYCDTVWSGPSQDATVASSDHDVQDGFATHSSCPDCRVIVTCEDWTIEVRGSNADDVRRVAVPVLQDAWAATSAWKGIEDRVDLVTLAADLRRLREKMRELASSTAEDAALGAVADAEEAALDRDGPRTLTALRKAGEWALSVANQIGVEVASIAIAAAVGLTV